MSLSAVVVSHGHAHELETLLPRLAPQVDELVVVANTPGSAPHDLPSPARVLENPSPRRLSENVNLGIAATTGEWVLFSNPDVVPEQRRRGGAARLRRDARALRDRGPPHHVAGREMAADAAPLSDRERDTRAAHAAAPAVPTARPAA